MNYRELIAEIEEGAEVKTAELPMMRSAVWFPQRTPMEVGLLAPLIPDDNPDKGRPLGSKDRETRAMIDALRPTAFRVNNPCPLHGKLTVISIFADEEEIRVYCAPLVRVGEVADPEPPPFSLYTLYVKNPVYTLTVMNVDVFLKEVAAEWIIVAGSGDEDDEEEGDEEEEAGGGGQEEKGPEQPPDESTPAPVAVATE